MEGNKTQHFLTRLPYLPSDLNKILIQQEMGIRNNKWQALDVKIEAP